MQPIYLDYNATAPLRPEAREAMILAMDIVGNPSSVHRFGRAARQRVEEARATVAALVGAQFRMAQAAARRVAQEPAAPCGGGQAQEG